MKHIKTNITNVVNCAKFTESPIETDFFHALMRTGKVTLCSDGAEPSGEGFFLFPQHHIGPYRVDFLIRARGYLPTQRVWPPRLKADVIIECDGKEFHSSEEQKKYDEDRDKYMKNIGIQTIRIEGAAIYKHANEMAEHAINRIDEIMKQGK